ncbi:MAG TPA: hypothetical protein DDZ62_13310 [Delftia acidovorans]|nr:hypothetical protein [Delftia acidovorans]
MLGSPRISLKDRFRVSQLARIDPFRAFIGRFPASALQRLLAMDAAKCIQAARQERLFSSWAGFAATMAVRCTLVTGLQ